MKNSALSPQPSGLKTYRAAIRAAWLPLVGRTRLKTYECLLIRKWFAACKDLDIILRAIKQVGDRARNQGMVIWSLGIIAGDLAALEQQRKRMQAGADMQRGDNQWREELADVLDKMAGSSVDPEYQVIVRELRDALPNLEMHEAVARFKEIRH